MCLLRSYLFRVPENDNVILISWQLSRLHIKRFREYEDADEEEDEEGEEEDAGNRTSCVWCRLQVLPREYSWNVYFKEYEVQYEMLETEAQAHEVDLGARQKMFHMLFKEYLLEFRMLIRSLLCPV